MDYAHAFTYIFQDRQWVRKLVPLAFFSFLSIIPVLGLLAMAVALGFMLQTAANVREGLPRPLPLWNDYALKFSIGGNILAAIIAYHLPVIIVGSCSTWLISALGSGFLGGTVALMATCCTFPMLIGYTGLVWALLGVGVAEYIETGESRRLFALRHLWDVLQTHHLLAIQWVMYALLTTILIAFLLVIPCVGWIAALLFGYAIYGNLLGQFAQKLALTNKPRARSHS
jgi:hypothetical protein